MSPNGQKLRGAGVKLVSACDKAQKQDEDIISKSKRKVCKVESDDDDSEFECHDKLDGKSVHTDVDRENRNYREEADVSATREQIGGRVDQQKC